MNSSRLRLYTLVLSSALAVAGTAWDADAKRTPTPAPTAASPEAAATGAPSGSPTPAVSATPFRMRRYPLPKLLAQLETTKGRMVLQLYPTDAPNTVANFVRLARKGFYDGVKFHRVVPGFVIQSGDPTGTGEGGPGWAIPFEKNDLVHVTGAVGMARDDDPDSAGSQFYVALNRVPHLDGRYVVFGQTVAGMDVAERIEAYDAKTGKGDRVLSVKITDVAGAAGAFDGSDGYWRLPEPEGKK